MFDGREGGFLKNLNKAASEGLRVIPGTIKAFEENAESIWMTVVEPAPDAPRVTYVVVKSPKKARRRSMGRIRPDDRWSGFSDEWA